MAHTPGKLQHSPAAVYADDGQSIQGSLVDYPTLEDMDPSLVDGFSLVYDREVPMELRSATTVDVPSEVGSLEAIRVRILIRGQHPSLEAVRVELSSESNLFFYYIHDLQPSTFTTVQELQRLTLGFNDYPAVLQRMLNACIREPHLHIAVLLLQPTGEARLDFIQNMEYKFLELLSCAFIASPEEMVKAQVSYRYNVVKARMQLLQTRLADINAMVKVKSPSLLLQMQRTAPRLPTGSPGPAFR